MNKNLDLDKLGLEKSLPSKSLLTTIDLGFKLEKPPEPEKITIKVPKKEVKKEEKKVLIIKKKTIKHTEVVPIEYHEKIDLLTTFSTGFIHNDIPVIFPQLKFHCHPQRGEDSIIESIDTGFGCSNLVVIECKKPKYKSHLCKENYLGEFKTEFEKNLARTNLGVYSKREIDIIVGQIIVNNKDFVTKTEVLNMISELDFVNSTLKSYASYQIPNDLFKL